MQIVAPLSYAPVGSAQRALAAPFTVSFALDNNWTVRFAASFQGDEVFPITLKVDNSGNNTPITFTNGYGTDTIPAYCIGYLDVATFYGMSFTCANPVSVNMTVLDYHVPAGFNPASSVTNITTNDPLFSKTIALYHFEDTLQSLAHVDSAINGFGVLTGIIQTDNTHFKFGNSSGKIANLAPTTATSANSISINQFFTIEFWIYIDQVVNTNVVDFITIGTQFKLQMQPQSASRVLWKVTFGGTTTGHLEGINVDGNWHHVAFCYSGAVGQYFLDGVGFNPFAADATTFTASTLVVSCSNDLECWVDELRITNSCRYTANFPVPKAPFLNQ